MGIDEVVLSGDLGESSNVRLSVARLYSTNVDQAGERDR
jgi:hypothetical protein